MKQLSGKTAFVTGGASGIGLGMVRAFLDEGMNAVVADLSDDHLAQARDRLAPQAGAGTSPAIEPVLTMCPPSPCLRSLGRKLTMPWITP